LLVVSVFALTGCVVWPSTEEYAPHFRGQVKNSGLAIRGAQIRVTSGFANDSVVQSTDYEGKFQTDRISKLTWVHFLTGDRLESYKLVIVADGKEYLGYQEILMGPGPGNIDLDCDLGQPIVAPHRAVPTYCSPSALAKPD
jgi:hypothetical protein